MVTCDNSVGVMVPVRLGHLGGVASRRLQPKEPEKEKDETTKVSGTKTAGRAGRKWIAVEDGVSVPREVLHLSCRVPGRDWLRHE